MTKSEPTTCQHCGESTYRSSTPTIDEEGNRHFVRHTDTGFTVCAEQ